MDEVDFYLMDLESRFKHLPKNKYYLSYSGGKDSHFLYWFIKEYMKRDDIEIVSINTYMEHKEIYERMKKNADRILIPSMKPFDIKREYGIPCFSKQQDDTIDRYQRGSRAPSVMKAINGEYSTGFNLSKKARNALLSGNLHRVSPKCCDYLKKKPFDKFAKESGKHPIMGIRGEESSRRRLKYKSCFTKSKKFVPIYDLKNDLFDKIYEKYDIETPSIYQYVVRTGCAGCPYGSYKHNTEKELALLPDKRRKFVIEYFRESYDVLGVPYEAIQEKLDLGGIE